MMKYILKIRKACALLILLSMTFFVFGCMETDLYGEDYTGDAYESASSSEQESSALDELFDNSASEKVTQSDDESAASGDAESDIPAEESEPAIEPEAADSADKGEEDKTAPNTEAAEGIFDNSASEKVTQSDEGSVASGDAEADIPAEESEPAIESEIVDSAEGDSSSEETTASAPSEENQEPKQEYVAPPSTGSSETMVWIPTVSGKRYHSKSTCSKMIDPSYVTISEAKRLGFTPCGKCYK